VAERLRVLEFAPDLRRPLENRTLDHDFAIIPQEGSRRL
jgi:hypothetical protein